MIRFVWQVAGLVALGLGILGIVLPLLPTTPFLLLSAFCFSRGSERLHNWLVNHQRFGPVIEDWRRHGAISRRTKLISAIAMAAVLALSLAVGVDGYIIAVQAVALAGAATFVLTRPLPPGER